MLFWKNFAFFVVWTSYVSIYSWFCSTWCSTVEYSWVSWSWYHLVLMNDHNQHEIKQPPTKEYFLAFWFYIFLKKVVFALTNWTSKLCTMTITCVSLRFRYCFGGVRLILNYEIKLCHHPQPPTTRHNHQPSTTTTTHQ